mmetsp:Transcript_5547/g.14659  ORF Transcript_5547/g.14659 Transcript_5547/m.14659 type:complete len:517 (+) Transcript_5547:3-1553(+)
MMLMLATAAVLSSCSDLKSCSTCITLAGLESYKCTWCTKDSTCHAVGSLVSACTNSDECVSLSDLSTCNEKNVEACPAADALPEQVHVALAGNGGMRVQWTTPKAVAASMVQFGEASALTSNASGSSRQYLANAGWHHSVLLAGPLTPGGEIFYRVGDGVSAWSRVLSFLVPRATAGVDTTINLAVFGDMGFQNSTIRPMQVAREGLEKEWSASYTYELLRRQVDERQVDGVWHVGDIGYADDSFSHAVASFTYETAYNGYMQWLEPIASRVPYMVTPGNHESECHSPACLARLHEWGLPLSNFSAFNARWTMPFAESQGSSNMWYSFDLGPVHFVSLNSETDWPGAEEETTGDAHMKALPAGSFGQPGEYLAWLEADLARAAAARDAGHGPVWIVAGSHRPFSAIESSHGELLRKYGVDAYFAGHSHSYTRDTHTFAADNSTLLTVVVGGAGCDEMKQAPKTAETGKTRASFHTARYASGVLRANVSTLHFELVDSEDGSLLDEVVLLKAAQNGA